jgi:hypothetical protein
LIGSINKVIWKQNLKAIEPGGDDHSQNLFKHHVGMHIPELVTPAIFILQVSIKTKNYYYNQSNPKTKHNIIIFLLCFGGNNFCNQLNQANDINP